MDEVKDFINNLPNVLRQKFAIATTALSEGVFDSVYIKQLKGEIKEVRIQKYRLAFFTYRDSIFFVRVFEKKTNKTPRKEIQLAEKYYELITNK